MFLLSMWFGRILAHCLVKLLSNVMAYNDIVAFPYLSILLINSRCKICHAVSFGFWTLSPAFGCGRFFSYYPLTYSGDESVHLFL